MHIEVQSMLIVVTSLLILGVLPMAEPTVNPANEPMAVPQASRTEIYKTIGEVELRIFIFNPPNHQATDRRPAIVFFFGGGWAGGHARQFAPQCAYLAGRGMVAMTAEYRVRSRHGTTPFECVKDGKSAVRWVRTSAARLGVDPNRIAAGGGSAGGHVAACTGVIDGLEEDGEDRTASSRPNAMVLFNPALLLGSIDGELDLPAERLEKLKDRFGKNSPTELSPYHALGAGAPPTIIFHGEADTTVPIESARAYAAKARPLGVRCELNAYPGAAHGFFNHGPGDNSAFINTMKAADRFLVSLGYLAGEPTIEQFQWTSTAD